MEETEKQQRREKGKEGSREDERWENETVVP